VLTEADVQISFRKLFQSGTVDPETLEQAQDLVDELRPESPLRHRLSEELEARRTRGIG
jgi:hypothetical protein